jgi:hypothetical protein
LQVLDIEKIQHEKLLWLQELEFTLENFYFSLQDRQETHKISKKEYLEADTGSHRSGKQSRMLKKIPGRSEKSA